MTDRADYDVVIIGGGFFGCCLALFLRSVTDRILIIEQQSELLTRASQANQARVHAGFHYPRSFVTALRSRHLSSRFAHDFKEAIVDDFQMLYAIARRRSKVSVARFQRMFQDMQAPFRPAKPGDAGLFDSKLIEGVFACDEFAFDWTVLQRALKARLAKYGIEVRHERTAVHVLCGEGYSIVTLDEGESVRGRIVFNVTFAGINQLLMNSGFDPLPLKHELAELALISTPDELTGKAVTVMDGPFFSLMPFPSAGLYSFTHVRYTPHLSWVDKAGSTSAYEVAASFPQSSRWRHMMMDAQRYLPCASGIEYRRSLFEVKTILVRNESDDGRPILLHRHHAQAQFYSVLGGKIDNIYDLFDFIPGLHESFVTANDRYLLQTTSA